MRTGSDGFFIESDNNTYLETVIQSILIVFFKNVCKNIMEFWEHINLYKISPSIIRSFLKLECIVLLERNNINEDVNEMMRYLESDNFQEEDDDEEILINYDLPTNYNCLCESCNQLRNVDYYWSVFNPTDSLLIILKNHINRLTDDDILDIFY